MKAKFSKNCENTGKFLKISCEICNFVKFDIHFLGLPSLVLLQRLITSFALQKCKSEFNML